MTFVEALDRIAPHEEPEISDALPGIPRGDGLTLRTGAMVNKVRREGADIVVLAGVYTIECGLTVKQVANIWCPYLTIADGIKLAAQAFTMEVAKLSCCAA